LLVNVKFSLEISELAEIQKFWIYEKFWIYDKVLK